MEPRAKQEIITLKRDCAINIKDLYAKKQLRH